MDERVLWCWRYVEDDVHDANDAADDDDGDDGDDGDDDDEEGFLPRPNLASWALSSVGTLAPCFDVWAAELKKGVSLFLVLISVGWTWMSQ